MGLFDFLRRKPAPPRESDHVEDDLDEPRCRHYTLAHHALRGLAFDQPLSFLGILASPEAPQFLSKLLEAVSESCEEREPSPDFDVEDLTVHAVRVGPFPCALVEMPRPRAIAEAYFVAAVLQAELGEGRPEPKDGPLRYFTLEKGFSLDGSRRTVFCEWTADGQHRNYGDGPAPRLEMFIQAMEKMLGRGRPNPA